MEENVSVKRVEWMWDCVMGAHKYARTDELKM